MPFRRRWIATTALVLTLAGCAEDEPEPDFEPRSESSSPSAPSSSASPTPEPWEKKTEAGAVAFAKHWVELLNAAGVSGEVRPVARLSTPQCVSCQNLVRYIEDVYKAGGHIESKGWEIHEEGVASGGTRDRTDVTLRVRQALQTIHRPGEDVARVRPATFTVSFVATWRSRWMADRVEVIE